MKLRSSLLCFFLGILVASFFATIGVRQMDEAWKYDAFNHGCGVYLFSAHNQKVSWMWIDDWFLQELKKYSPPATPQPAKLESL